MSPTSSNSNLHKASITWTIDDFPSIEANGSSVKSSYFTSATYTEVIWQLVLVPSGENDTISLYLYPNVNELPSHCSGLYATLTAHILTNNGGKTPSKQTKVHQYAEVEESEDEDEEIIKSIAWGWKKFWTKDEHFRTNLLSNNALTICIEVVFSPIYAVAVKHSYSKMSLKSYTKKCNLSENLASLLETQAFSDVVLCINGKDFPAHKSILAARSKVFAAMFQHDTKENRINRIDIEDLSAETVAEMLRFIYTGKCEKLDELAEELLAAADKYDLDVLKITSSKALYNTLSADNASRILILADMYNSEKLKNDVIEFIVSRAFDVTCTAGWKNLLPKSQLVGELFQALARHQICEEFQKVP